MQIRIIEAELRTVVEGYVRKLLPLGDNVEINIDFSATRGEEGLTTIIDLVPIEEGTSPVTVTNNHQAEPTKPVAASSNEGLGIAGQVKRTRRTKAQIEADNARAEAEARGETVTQEEAPVRSTDELLAASEANDEADDLPVEEEALAEGDASIAEIAEQREAEVVKEAPPARSLFANLGRPVNA